MQRSAGAGGGNEAEKFGYELNPQVGDARGLLEYNYIAKMTPHTQFCLFFFFFLPCNLWDLGSLTKGSNLCPLKGRHRVLTTGPPGKSLSRAFVSVILQYTLTV